jgi:hypothetical protein
MGILGEPDAELVDLLSVIEEIQQRARSPIRRGTVGFRGGPWALGPLAPPGLSGFCSAWRGPHYS